MGAAVVGTIVITFWATVIAVPLGILGAVYVTEYGAGNRLARVIRFMSDVMAGVPSIVMGLFIFTAFTLRIHKLEGIGGSLALACLMLPIVIRSTESMLSLVSRELREASHALGTTKSRTVLTVVLPAALPGITSGCLLAVARAAGETAPLLFTIGTLQLHSNWNAFKGSNTTLSAQIFVNVSSPNVRVPQARGWVWLSSLSQWRPSRREWRLLSLRHSLRTGSRKTCNSWSISGANLSADRELLSCSRRC